MLAEDVARLKGTARVAEEFARLRVAARVAENAARLRGASKVAEDVARLRVWRSWIRRVVDVRDEVLERRRDDVPVVRCLVLTHCVVGVTAAVNVVDSRGSDVFECFVCGPERE